MSRTLAGRTPFAPSDAADAARPVSLAAADAYETCARIAAASGSSFMQAFSLLAPERRRGLEALYAFCRVVDDAADEGAGGAATLARWREELDAVFGGTPRDPVAVALADTVRRFDVARRHLEEILTGVEMDLACRRYETFEDLRIYCRHVASAVGLASLPILGCRSARAEHYAETLGIALQLTNVLRDVAEDVERGRVYLPLEDLRRVGYAERDLATHTRGPAFRALIALECQRAHELYRVARAALPSEDRPALAPAEAMRLVYQRLLARIARKPEALFGPRVRVPLVEKLACVLAAWLASRGGRAA
jgi:phytoene synthase